MNCAEPNRHPTNRCIAEGINWAPDPQWATCPSCGDTCSLTCVDQDDPVLTIPQSRARQYNIEQERERELAQAEAARNRLITAATAALNYDLDRWMTEGADWVAEGAT